MERACYFLVFAAQTVPPALLQVAHRVRSHVSCACLTWFVQNRSSAIPIVEKRSPQDGSAVFH